MRDFTNAQHVSLLLAAADLARTSAPPGRSLFDILNDVKTVHAGLLAMLADQTTITNVVDDDRPAAQMESEPATPAAYKADNASNLEADRIDNAAPTDTPCGFVTLWDDSVVCQTCGTNFKPDSIIEA